MKFKVTYGKTEAYLRVEEQVAVIQDQQIPKDEVLSLMEAIEDCAMQRFRNDWVSGDVKFLILLPTLGFHGKNMEKCSPNKI